MTLQLGLTVGVVALYALWLVWYGGKGAPLSHDEVERYMAELATHTQSPHDAEMLDAVRALVAKDDGREFVMQNLVRYRAKALYPSGYNWGDNPREADKRYGRGIIPHLLRYGNVPVFIGRRIGDFIEPEGSTDWHYVAMVRYRSKRDFLRFACAIQRADLAVHKWAALETTHVFPVRPILSLIMVRLVVAACCLVLGIALWLVFK